MFRINDYQRQDTHIYKEEKALNENNLACTALSESSPQPHIFELIYVSSHSYSFFFVELSYINV